MANQQKCLVCAQSFSTNELVIAHMKQRHPDWMETKLVKDYIKLVESNKTEELGKIVDQQSAMKVVSDTSTNSTANAETSSETKDGTNPVVENADVPVQKPITKNRRK
jgi:hypothetical protein